MAGLLESLKADAKELGLENELDGINLDDEDEDGEYDPETVRERIEQRKQRGAGDGDDGSSSDDGGSSRGTGGNAPGDSKTPSEDGKAPLEDEPEPNTPAAWAKHRREKREMAARIKELEDAAKKPAEPAKPIAAESAKVDAKPATAEAAEAVKKRTVEELGKQPDRNEDLAGWLVWQAEKAEIINEENSRIAREALDTQKLSKTEQLVRTAAGELDNIQNEYKKVNADYDNALNFAKNEYRRAVKLMLPNKTDADIDLALKQEIFGIGLQCAKDGTNLGEVIYDMAIERFGYVPNSQPASRDAKKPRIDLSQIERNKRRSASSMEGGGEAGKRKVSIEQKSEMTIAEMLALDADDWDD